MQLGLEMEFWVVDGAGELCDGRDLAAVHEDGVPEFVPPLLEVRTPPRGSVSAIGERLLGALEAILREANRTDRRLVPLGTPLTPCTAPVASERGDVLERIYGDGLAVAKNCAGTHVHFEHGNVARQLNLLTALDPALALVGSSPYYGGERLAASSRTYAYRYLAGSTFARYRTLWSYAEDVAEWEERLREVYDGFRAVARNRDVPPDVFDELFDPEDVVTTPVRLREETPTVEWRAPDTTFPSQILRLLDDVVPLVARTADLPVVTGDPGVGADRIVVPEYADLQQLSDAAIERGLEATPVWKYLEAMGVDTTRFHPVTDQIYAAETIPDERARRVRLEFGRLLEWDVERNLGDRP